MKNKKVSNRFLSMDEGVQHVVSAGSMKDAFKFLYQLAQTNNAVKVEYQVYNPNPTQFDPAYLIPRDTYLSEDGEKMLGMDMNEMVRHCTRLAVGKKVPAIGVVFGMDPTDTIRFTAQILLIDSIRATVGNAFPIACSVNGGTKQQNEQIYHDVVEATYERLKAHDA